MSHFAKVLDGKVIQVIVAEQDFIDNMVDTSPGEWIQTSYNTSGGVHYNPETREPSEDQTKALRKNFAGKGMIYDRQRDAFYKPQPYPSWTLNEDTCLWEAPVSRGEGDDIWDEENQTWLPYSPE
jgi:uncharacterized protein (DUF2126 family)